MNHHSLTTITENFQKGIDFFLKFTEERAVNLGHSGRGLERGVFGLEKGGKGLSCNYSVIISGEARDII